MSEGRPEGAIVKNNFEGLLCIFLAILVLRNNLQAARKADFAAIPPWMIRIVSQAFIWSKSKGLLFSIKLSPRKLERMSMITEMVQIESDGRGTYMGGKFIGESTLQIDGVRRLLTKEDF